MERPDRTPITGVGAGPGPTASAPLASAQPTLVRGLPDNTTTTTASISITTGASSTAIAATPPQARRPVHNSAAMSNAPAPPPPMPLPPLPGGRNGPPSAALPSTPMNPAQVIALVRTALNTALENEAQAVEAGSVGPRLKSGVTIDLSRQNIQTLPEEVIDILKNELERLALSHNQLTSLPTRFSECASLRYLNIRGNQIKEFPMPLCDLSSLEILDLGRNQLRVLPPEISKLTSLKVLSIPKNQIRELPLCLADMISLQVLKFEGNPISFPPREALHVPSSSPPNEHGGRDDVSEVVVTAHIKKFLKLHAINGRESEAGGDDSSEGNSTDGPRFPLKRVVSGRFPIKVSTSDASEMRSPNLARPPPIPNRSHYRGLSQQNTATRRPTVLPLTIGNVNERLRSNSETIIRSERPDSRQRRMGMLPKKAASDLSTLNEIEVNNRFSHYRGLSHESAMHGTGVPAKSPATPTTESPLQRPVYVRRLSVLPERRRESKVFDPVIEAAKGILYSVFQIHPMIQMLMTLTNDGASKRSSLEIVFYNTNSHVEELEQEIQKYDTVVAETGELPSRDNANVHRACQTLVGAYGHVCTLLADNIDTFVQNGDARYIRSLLMLIYNSIMELRVTLSSVSAQYKDRRTSAENSDTIKPYFKEASAAVPSAHKPIGSRGRNGTIVQTPSNLRLATDAAAPFAPGPGRGPRYAGGPPRSNESTPPSVSREMPVDFAEDDSQFERVFLSLQKATDVVMNILPNFHVQLNGGIRNAMQQRAPSAMIRDWKSLIALCNDVIQQTESLKSRLSAIKVKEPGGRNQSAFWHSCTSFISSWTKMAHKIKAEINTIPLPPDTRGRLRPIHQQMKETSNVILQSPWHHLFRPSGSHGGSSGSFGQNILSPTQMSITPQSAALGPAMQATVATPQTGSFAAVFQGNVFDRADTLMANPGISMSRTGTMTRGHSGFNSLSSISSMSSDGAQTPATAFSPGVQMGPQAFRMNGGKVPL